MKANTSFEPIIGLGYRGIEKGVSSKVVYFVIIYSREKIITTSKNNNRRMQENKSDSTDIKLCA